MKLKTINAFLNLFLIALVVDAWDGYGERIPARLYFTTIFRAGYVVNYPHIRLLTWLGM